MEVTVRKKGRVSRLLIDGDATIYSAAELKMNTLGALAEASEVEVDLGRVQELDTAGLQVLMLLKRLAVERGKPIRFVNHSAAVLEVFDLCNVVAHFGDPVILPSQA